MASAERDFRQPLDIKEVDARGNRLAADSKALTNESKVGAPFGIGQGGPLDLRHDSLQSRLDALERLVKEAVIEKNEKNTPKHKKKQGKEEILRSGGHSDHPRKSELYRSSSGRPAGKSKERDTLYRSTAQGQFKSYLYDPKIEKEVMAE